MTPAKPRRPTATRCKAQCACRPAPRLLTLLEATHQVAGLSRETLLRRAASALATAARREGQAGAGAANRNAITVALACLGALKERGR